MRINESRVPLSTGTPIHGYSIVKAISSDDISITYRAISSTSNRLVIINEFFPAALATRNSSFRDISITDASKANTLQDSLDHFSRVIELLVDCEHPSLNRTLTSLQHGGTVLSVHEKLDSPTLQQHIQQQTNRILPEADIRQLMLPLVQGLQHLHSKGVLHLGIQPEHILIKDLNSPVLTHFTQSQCIGNSSTLAALLSMESVPAQLAPELLSKKSALTPASDIYALGMTLYTLMTGIELPLAQDRLNAILDNEPDPLPPLREHAAGYSHALYQLVESCVRLRQKDRPQSISEVLEKLEQPAEVTNQPKASYAKQQRQEQSQTTVVADSATTTNFATTAKPAAINKTVDTARSAPLNEPGAQDQHATPATESPKLSRNLQYSAAAIAVGLLISVTYAISKPSAEDKQLLTEHHSMERLAQLEAERLERIRQLYQLVSVPAGHFTMGCQGTGCPEQESPGRAIDVPAFQMMAHQVTFAMWDTCVEQGGCSHRPRDEGWGRSNQPVINVSFEEITTEFIPWLSQASRQKFRLPSEVEWEYAAKAGAEAAYQFGDNIRCDQARYGRRNGGECSSQLEGPTAIMSFNSNTFGLHDMHGNVWEWTQDCWNADYQQATATTAPILTGNCVRRVQRGGSWFSPPNELTTTYRTSHDAKIRHRNNGFRLVLAD